MEKIPYAKLNMATPLRNSGD